MSWFGFGSKKKKPEDKNKIKLDQLSKLGYTDRKKNLQLLKLYNGDVNHVIQDYAVQKSSSQSRSPKKQEPKKSPQQKPKSSPKQQAKVAPKSSPKQQAKAAPKSSPKQKAQITPKQSPPKQEAQVAPKKSPPQKAEVAPKSAPKQKTEKIAAQQAAKVAPKQSSPKQEAQPVKKVAQKAEQKQSPKAAQPKEARKASKASPKFPKATMAKATLKSTQSAAANTALSAAPQLTNNLRNLISSDIRLILLNIGEPIIGEIALSNSISGAQIYDYSAVNPLLKKLNLSFSDEASYKSLLKQMELSYEKRGAINAYDKSQTEEKQAVSEAKETVNADINYEALKQNIPNLISSDVRNLILPLNVELAERLYAFSVCGADLYALDYNGAIFVSGMKQLKKADWDKIVTELKLPESEPFDAKKWKQLQQDQEAVIQQAQNMEQQIKSMQKTLSQKPQQEQKVAPKQTQANAATKLARRQKKQLAKIEQREKELDKFMPTNLQKLKQRQLETLSVLHDVASIINLDANTVAKVAQSARRESEREVSMYLKSGKVPPAIVVNEAKPESKTDEIRPQDIEQRQLKLLSTIHATREKLQTLAQSKGVSLDALQGITSSTQEEKVSISALTQQFDDLFQNLATIAVSVQETANKYGVQLNDDKEINKFIEPMYRDLESKQNALIARIQYLNDQARMINPKAVEVNEEILHISRQSHRRSSSGPSHLAVPRSPGESPTPHDHFPDTLESKEAYEQMSEHPSSLPKKHSRSPSLTPVILITSPDETEREANQVRQRRKSLQVNAAALEKTLKQFDKNKDGYLNGKTFVAALKKMKIGLDLKDDNVKIILKDVTDDGKGINIQRMLNFVGDPRTSLKLESCKQWNSFRMRIISAKM